MDDRAAPGSDRPFRTLLPGRLPASTSPPPAEYARVARRISAVAACKACRKQKAKCSGERPACRRCIQRHVQCHYTTQPGERHLDALKRNLNSLQDQATAHAELIELLRNRPEQEAQDILQRIRSRTDVKTILNQVKAGDLLLQMAVVPETRFRYEFPYKSEIPEDYILNNPYLNSIIYEATSLYSTDQDSNYASLKTSGRFEKLGSSEYQSLYLKPFHAAQVVDPLLSNVKISLWTTVCDDDDLMRDLLRVFLRCEYHFTAIFQKDLFLEDMATEQHDFCSSLLVNIILAYSCVCYPGFSNRAEYWNPNTLLYKFLAEAKRIWELEATDVRLTTVQAGVLFNVFHNLCGLDEIGQAYRINSIVLANKLRLFNSSLGGSERIRRGRAYTAWALYNWETLIGFSFMFPPLLKTPPDWPLPDPSIDAQFYGEVWVKYPLTHSLLPSYFGHVFRARSQFRVIMNEFCQVAFSQYSEINLGKAIELRARLQDWYDGLAGPLLSTTIVLPGHLQLHAKMFEPSSVSAGLIRNDDSMYYHNLLLVIYEPLLDVETNQEPSPQQIVSDAQKHMQTLLRLYYLRHGYEAMDLFIVVPLMLAGYKCIDDINEQVPGPKLEGLRSTLILIAKVLYHQRRNHYLAEALFRVIRGRMRQDEFALLKSSMRIDDEEDNEKRDLAQAVRSHWPVSVVKKKEDVESYILTHLVEAYGHLNVDENVAQTDDSQ